jgi:hypothetical protein
LRSESSRPGTAHRPSAAHPREARRRQDEIFTRQSLALTPPPNPLSPQAQRAGTRGTGVPGELSRTRPTSRQFPVSAPATSGHAWSPHVPPLDCIQGSWSAPQVLPWCRSVVTVQEHARSRRGDCFEPMLTFCSRITSCLVISPLAQPGRYQPRRLVRNRHPGYASRLRIPQSGHFRLRKPHRWSAAEA